MADNDHIQAEDDHRKVTPWENKVEILKGAAPDMSAATFCIYAEDHTLGNALRWAIMKDPQVEFCGYTVPHPSEQKIHLRIQMYDNASTIDCLYRALDNLDDVCSSVLEAYNNDLARGEYERWEDPKLDLEAIKARKAGTQQGEGEGKTAGTTSAAASTTKAAPATTSPTASTSTARKPRKTSKSQKG